jgi:hypothetical protein
MNNIIRTWVRNQNSKGKMLKAKHFFSQWADGEINVVSVFYKVINPIRFRYYTLIKGYNNLILEDYVKNGVFKIFISNSDPKEVVKFPRKDNIFSLRFTNKLHRKRDFQVYQETLLGLSRLPFIHKHIADVRKIYRNGGYSSSYINGANLVVIKNSDNEIKYPARDIILAIDLLCESIQSYIEAGGKLSGDWMLQNLVYDEVSKRIINVDLEGFFLYIEDESETQFDVIYMQLNTVKEALLQRNF